jgi:hypothetical protein
MLRWHSRRLSLWHLYQLKRRHPSKLTCLGVSIGYRNVATPVASPEPRERNTEFDIEL